MADTITKESIMDNSIFGIIFNSIGSLFGWMVIGKSVESITDTVPNLDYIKIIVTTAAESGVDITSKVAVLALTIMSLVTSSITIGQFIYKVYSNKKK
jgi:hypothetical protein|tara:strand:+ start:254 stop:547 length:294 start_codon:yes stop_codon:yes gene_type:complete